jgi:hypothetical protein
MSFKEICHSLRLEEEIEIVPSAEIRIKGLDIVKFIQKNHKNK